MKALKTFVFIVFVLLLAACGANDDAASSDSEEPAAGGDDANSDEVFKLKYNSAFPPSIDEWDPKYKATEEFAKLVEERSDGRLEIEVFYSNQLAGQAESLDALAKGTIDIQNLTPSAWGDKIPEGDFAALMYWNINEEHSLYVMRETEIGDLYEEAMNEYGVQVLSYWPASATGLMSTKRIASPEDFKGLIMNVSSSLTTDFYTDLDAGVAAVPFAEQYEGLLRGTIDAIQFPFYALEDYKLAEVVDYISTPATVSPALGLVSISQKTMEKLPEDLQQILIDTALEMEQEGIEGSKRLTEEAYEYAEENDVERVVFTEEDYNEFLELSKKTSWAAFAEKNERTKKMIDLLDSVTEEWMEENPDQVEEFQEEFSE